MRWNKSRFRPGTWAMAILLGGAICLAGCDDDHHDHHHRPPYGFGSLVVDNDTDNDISVFLDGFFMERIARDGHVTAYDLYPGLYRVLLEERGGHRYFVEDIDILPDRSTVIYAGGYYTDYYYIDIWID